MRKKLLYIIIIPSVKSKSEKIYAQANNVFCFLS